MVHSLSIVNERPSFLAGPQCLHDLVPLSSHTNAIDFLDTGNKRREFSYQALHRVSNALARRITSLAAELPHASPIIPILIPQCPELYIAILAVLKAGRAFCPLLVDTPVERLDFILHDIAADFVITLTPHWQKLQVDEKILPILADVDIAEETLESSLPTVHAHDLAYVLYTSGSTGVPKAVQLSHQAATQSLLAHDRHLPEFSRFLQFAAPTFDVSIFEIFFPWFRGKTLVGCSRSQMLDDLPKLINDLDVDAAELTPTVVSSLLHGRSSVPGLTLLLTIGEMLNHRVVEEYGGDGCKEGILWAMYGPTEAAIHCTLQPRMSTKSTIATIGFPLDTVSAFVVAPAEDSSPTAHIQVLPMGEVGELAIGGPQVAEGYLNRPDLSAAVFVNHPRYGRMYRTGDRVKIRTDGGLEFLGRITVGQVKLRGQRIELGEIEQVIMMMDASHASTVMIIDDKLVAFITVGSGRVSPSDVLSHCKERLPDFMVPGDVCLLTSVPQLPSGKIDRNLLKSQYQAAAPQNGTPTSALKRASLSQWDDPVVRKIMQVIQAFTTAEVMLHTYLPSIGIDSLQSIRLASLLRREGFILSGLEVLAASSVADLIAVCRACVDADREKIWNGTHISNSRHTSTTTHAFQQPHEKNLSNVAQYAQALNKSTMLNSDAIVNGAHNEDATTFSPHSFFEQPHQKYPCTPLQESMLAVTSSRPRAYCNWIEVELSIPYTYAEIRNSLIAVCQNNEILRTGFTLNRNGAGNYTQIVWNQVSHSHIRHVSKFSRSFSLSTEEALLHPVRMDIQTDSEKSRILFQIHHAMYDGWSFDLLLEDLVRHLYTGTMTPRPQFRDVANYFVHGLPKEKCAQARNYWNKLLHGVSPLALPNYYGKVMHHTGLRRLCKQSRVTPRLLFQHARDSNVSPQTYFQAAIAFLLKRYSGSNDVVFGTVNSGRTIPVTGIEDIMGPCIASVPYRINLEDTIRVQDLLHMTQDLNRRALQYNALSLREITKAAGYQPGINLFDVLFVWQQSLNYGITNTPPMATIVDSADESEMKLTLEFEPRQDSITFRATYDTSMFPDRQIEYLALQIDELVQLFMRDASCTVAEMDCCFTTASLSIQNPTPPEYSIQNGPSHAVEEWAMKDPDRPAICFGHMVEGVMQPKETTTYATLNMRANQLARVLSEFVSPHRDQLVAIIMEKSVNLYVSILAVSKLGCGYLPLVPDTPSDRISIILRDAQITVCISASEAVAALPKQLSLTILDVDLLNTSIYPNKNLNIPYCGHHLAYAIFTSGTTGRPKGVLVTQDNLMSNLLCLSDVYPYSAGSRILQACSHAFDVSVFEIFFAWHAGMCLCTASKDDLFHDLEASIRRLEITHLSLTPTVAALIDPINVPQVEFLVTAGEAMTERVRRRWAGRGLYQGYGPSETTNICTLRPSVSVDDLANNIGMPCDSTSAFVLDPKSDSFLPRGAVGELCFGGIQVFRGYLDRPELNSIKLIQHPLYGKIYRTGDMGIMLPDGAMLFTGRSDDQVKIRGQRVELGEIASVALDDAAIQDCVTLLLPGRDNNDRTDLISFWVPLGSDHEKCEFTETSSAKNVVSRLFDSMSRRLPSYMVPTHIIPISSIPMTIQAKIDKSLLQSIFYNLNESQIILVRRSESAAQNSEFSEWERSVASILSKTLGQPLGHIQRNTSFFNLGLDSVSAIRLCNELRKANLSDFAISTVLKNPSIAQLAASRDSGPMSAVSNEDCTIESEQFFSTETVSTIRSVFNERGTQVLKIRPCTPLQEAMLSSAESSSSVYCNVLVFEVIGQLVQLQESWLSIVKRHEILRSAFVPTNDPSHAFAQVVLDGPTIKWHSISSLDNLQSHIATTISALLSIHEPPIQFAVHRERTSTKLLFGCHHALYDGSAISILLQEVQDVYNGVRLPPPITFDGYLQHTLSQDMKRAEQYWSTMLEGYQATSVPTLTGKVGRSGGTALCVTRCLQLSLSETLTACRDASTSLLSIIHATWAKLLHFYTGESDVCFGNVVSGRNIPITGVERLVAPCFNTLPVRVNFDFDQANASLVSTMHALNVEMLAYQMTPLRRIQTSVLKDGGTLFDTLVILQQPTVPLDTSIWTLEQDMGDMNLPLVCEIMQDRTRDSLELLLHYNTSLLSEIDAATVAKTFDFSLSSILSSPQASANDTQALPADLRAEYHLAARSSVSNPRFLHSSVERMAITNPSGIALDFLESGGTRMIWSFETLNTRANNIAHMLIRDKILPGDIVPLHLPKCPEFYAAILGILKAGAAFAPVHPDLPVARKKLMLRELNPRIILCSQSTLVHIDGAKSLFVEFIERHGVDNPVVHGLRETNLAYCLFTSGSTGIPKAVSMEHRSPVQTIECSRCLVPWNASSRLLQYAAVTFDMCYYDCFLAWTFGFTLCAAEQDILLNELTRVINTLNVSLLDLTPSVAVSLRRSQVPSVEWLYCIGEVMSSQVAREWAGACANSYGPTEAAFCTTIFPVCDGTSTSVIGKPFPGTSFAIFPTRGHSPLPVLSMGELYIGGAQLARGYLGKPQLTDDRFVHIGGRRYYKSGDVVRMLSDGNFEFVGRVDDQVKIRGLRVELGEINHVLQRSCPDVKNVVTQIIDSSKTAKSQLVAFLVMSTPLPKERATTVQKQLKDAAVEQLPPYMVPQFFCFIEEIPRSMSGKIDKQKITKFFHDRIDDGPVINGKPGHSLHHRWTQLEEKVRGIMARLSRTSIEDISPTTTIFHLGLDSISAVQIAAALRKQGYAVKAADIMKYMTCVDIASHISQEFSANSISSPRFDFETFHNQHIIAISQSCGIPAGDILAVRPCTPLQKAMVSQFIAKEGSVYINHVRLRLEHGMQASRVKEVWPVIMRRHEMLRTGFAHIEHAQHPFVMVLYDVNAAILSRMHALDAESDSEVDAWMKHIQQLVMSKLHCPTWAFRLVRENGENYVDIAIFHGLFDAQSLQAILDDFAAEYSGQTLGPPVALGPAIDGILSMSDECIQDSVPFWTELGKKTNPSHFPNLSPLRCDPLSPAISTRLSSKTLAELEEGCKSANITLQAAGIASWLSLLSVYTGEVSVTCGVVLSGRSFDSAAHAVFPCINTVPFPCTISKSRRELLEKVMSLNAQVQQYQCTPLSDIQRLMGYPSEPLFDTLFAYQKLPPAQATATIWHIVEENSTTEYPVSIEIQPRNEHLEYRLTFLPHMIPQSQARLILGQLDHLMDQIIFGVSSSAPSVNTDSMLYSITPAKQPSLYSETQLLHEFVEQTASKTPHRTALEFVDSLHHRKGSVKRWTYAELDAEGNRIAHLLLFHNIEPGELVGVCFEKCPEASFAMLGILKAGCAFVAIDPGAPAARQAFIVKDSGVRAVLSMAKQSMGFRDCVDTPVLNLDETKTQYFLSSTPILCRNIGPGDRSYCLYTSGTTGTPKGCELTHENAVQAMLAFKRLFAGHWDAESRWLQFASFHFDVSVLEQFWSWSVGICVVSTPRDMLLEDLAYSINALQITHIDLTPSLAQILHPDDVPSLCRGVFITGGESLKQEILDAWGPRAVIYNGYGPTEATIGCTMYPRVPANGKPSNIGWQFDNVGSLVLEPHSDQPVLRGGVGELCVTGKLVGKGYLNRPELTAERFPHLGRFGERVYRTGDLVRVLHDLTFEFLGRADDQVKLRGQRLEVGEINSVIKQSSSAIADAATLVLRHPKQQKEQLVSFVVLGAKRNREPEIILGTNDQLVKAKEACYDKLPPYMVPTHLLSLSSMPLNANHKANAKKLRQLFEELAASDLQKLSATTTTIGESWTKVEQDIRHTLSGTLNIPEDSINKDSSFFELGMDSISAIGVTRAMKLAGVPNANVSLVMKYSTIRQLAKTLRTKLPPQDDRGSLLLAQQLVNMTQHCHRRAVARALGVSPTAIEAIAPCTPLQQGMIARCLGSDSGLYLNTFRFRLGESIDMAKLREAWSKLFLSTQILRTAFVNTEDGFVQAVSRETSFCWLEHQVQEDRCIHEVLEQLRQQWLSLNRLGVRQPFELHILTTPSEKLLVVHLFHGLYDGNSIQLMIDLVWHAYKEPGTIDSGPSFYSALPHGPLRSNSGAKEFWQKQGINAGPRPFPPLIASPGVQPVAATRNIKEVSALDSVRRKLNVTAQAVAQSCWLGVLQRYTRSNTTIGMVVSGRSLDLQDAERIIGPMFNTIPYHHRIQSGESWAQVTKRLHEFNIAAQPYQHTPLRNIIKWCKQSGDQPLFDTLFAYQPDLSEAISLRNEAWEFCGGEAAPDFPLAFEVVQMANDDLHLTLVSQGHISDRDTCERLLDQFESNLRQFLADPSIIFGDSDGPGDKCDDGGHKDDCQPQPLVDVVSRPSNFEWTDTAIQIREEIASLSGFDRADISEITSIFEMGLDSIDAIKLSSKLKRHGINLAVSGIMRGLSISRMMESMEEESAPRNAQSAHPGLGDKKRILQQYMGRRNSSQARIESVLPLTPLQEAMVAGMVASDYTRYYNYDVLRVEANTDVDKLRAAWSRVVEASPILRTGFVAIDDPGIDYTFAQVVNKDPHDFWSHLKIESEPDFPAIFDSLRADALSTPLSVPLVRVVLVETPQLWYLVLAIAHALYDGWSLGLLHADVDRAYHGQYHVRPSYEPVLEHILSASGDDAAEFWQDYLSGAKSSGYWRRSRPAGRGVPHVYRREKSGCVALVDVTLFARKSGVSLQTIGQAAFAMVLASYVGCLDVTFGSVLSGRDDGERAQLLFPTMNTVAVRTILHGTCRELLRYMQSNATSIQAWQHFPLRKSLALAGLHEQLFESLFIYQKSMEEMSQEGEKLYTSIQGRSEVEYPVCVEMQVVGHELVWRCAVDEAVFSEGDAGELLERMDAVLGRMCQEPDAPVIRSTEQGTSVCGLPAFEEKSGNTAVAPPPQEGQETTTMTPDTHTIDAIREALAQVSRTPQEEITDDMTIFHIGLDSISAIKAHALLRQSDIHLSVGEMLRAGSVKNMASIVTERVAEPRDRDDDYRSILAQALQDLDTKKVLENAQIAPASVSDIFPLGAGQLYMLSMWLHTQGGNFYPEFKYHLKGHIMLEVLQQSWRDVVAGNPILRTVIVPTYHHGTPYVQVVLREPVSSVTDLTGYKDDEREQTIHSNASKQPWAHIFVAQQRHGWDVTLKIHHALYDGVSLPLIIQHFQDICNGIPLPPAANDTWPRFLASSHTDAACNDGKAFWTHYLEGPLATPFPPPHAPPTTTRTEVYKPALLAIGPLEAIARKHGLSLQALFLAVFAKLHATTMAHNSDPTPFLLGIYLANRSLPLPALASAPIPTLNLLPLRIQAPSQHSTLSLAAALQADLHTITSTPGLACVSLAQLAAWTGLAPITTFVNFVPPAPGTDSLGRQVLPQRIALTSAHDACESIATTTPLAMPDSNSNTLSPPWTKQVVHSAYQHAIDVEATVRNGALHVGVFAPGTVLSVGEAERWIEELRQGLEAVGGEA